MPKFLLFQWIAIAAALYGEPFKADRIFEVDLRFGAGALERRRFRDGSSLHRASANFERR